MLYASKDAFAVPRHRLAVGGGGQQASQIKN
jgi:hypothetical protein